MQIRHIQKLSKPQETPANLL